LFLTPFPQTFFDSFLNLFINSFACGFIIETGGHVFQLHFSNSTGMNEKAFITNTTDDWGKGEIRFGFNLSGVFTITKKFLKNNFVRIYLGKV
jgi:hypothetical protein